MHFVVCGFSHHQTPLEIREKMAHIEANADYVTLRTITSESVILVTCNRTEIYTYTNRDIAVIRAWFFAQCKEYDIEPYVYTYTNIDVLRHILRVASGLDSMMIGESQILAQMKKAYHQAIDREMVKSHMHLLFQHAFSVAKDIRQGSGLGQHAISVAYIAAQRALRWIEDTQPMIDSAGVLVIGSGGTSALVLKYLSESGIGPVIIASRNTDTGTQLAETCEGRHIGISDIGSALDSVSLVISATTCPLPFIDSAMVEEAMARRAHRPLCFLDLAVPRDIEDSVRDIEHVTVYNIDDLQHEVAAHWQERQLSAIRAEALIEKALSDFDRYIRSQDADMLVTAYRNHVANMVNEELEQALSRLSHGVDSEDALRLLAHRIFQKLVHSPTEGLRTAYLDGRQDVIDLAYYCFKLPTRGRVHEEIA